MHRRLIHPSRRFCTALAQLSCWWLPGACTAQGAQAPLFVPAVLPCAVNWRARELANKAPRGRSRDEYNQTRARHPHLHSPHLTSPAASRLSSLSPLNQRRPASPSHGHIDLQLARRPAQQGRRRPRRHWTTRQPAAGPSGRARARRGDF
jgi:hypothetical protein